MRLEDNIIMVAFAFIIDINESIEKMKRVEDEDRITVRQKLTSEVGFTGVSILH